MVNAKQKRKIWFEISDDLFAPYTTCQGGIKVVSGWFPGRSKNRFNRKLRGKASV